MTSKADELLKKIIVMARANAADNNLVGVEQAVRIAYDVGQIEGEKIGAEQMHKATLEALDKHMPKGGAK